MEPPYRCIHCKEGFDSPETMISHVDTREHSSGTKLVVGWYCCDECFNRFDFQIDVEDHIRDCHSLSVTFTFLQTGEKKMVKPIQPEVIEPQYVQEPVYRVWPFELTKKFEDALVVYDTTVPNRWEKIAAAIGDGVTPEEVEIQFWNLVADIDFIQDESNEFVFPPHWEMDSAELEKSPEDSVVESNEPMEVEDQALDLNQTPLSDQEVDSNMAQDEKEKHPALDLNQIPQSDHEEDSNKANQVEDLDLDIDWIP